MWNILFALWTWLLHSYHPTESLQHAALSWGLSLLQINTRYLEHRFNKKSRAGLLTQVQTQPISLSIQQGSWYKYKKKSGVEIYLQGNTHTSREDRTTLWRALAGLLVCLSATLSTSQQSGRHSIFDSNCLVSHYIPLNIGPISLLTRLAVTTESHWHSQSHSPLGPQGLYICVSVFVCTCVKDTARLCQFWTYLDWGNTQRVLITAV